MKKSLGIYLHIPFCVKKCGYCDFCSFPNKDETYIRMYTDELCRRISKASADEYCVDTVYFGGGTPSLLPLSCVEQLMSTLVRRFDIDSKAEISFECNPATADFEYFKSIKSLGINRISMGLQSTNDRELTLLGRVHSFEDFVDCFNSARRAGFDNISADLMYGIPEQTMNSFEKSIDMLCDIAPEHISAYGLTVEENTPFYLQKNNLSLASDDMQAQMYLLCSQKLSDRGFEKYEISNFSKNGNVSRHNLRYWHGLEYIGFGVSAHSFFKGERFGSSRNINAFLAGEDITEERYTISDKEKHMEYVMLSLRLCKGIDINEYKEKFKSDFFCNFPQAYSYIKNGFMHMLDEHIAFTDMGFLLSNSLLSDMLDFS